ncbi:M24 family metallopeptidase [Thermodesulfatator autotrophicus]|uniref:M24 family metallopeptidase n=1 Tax=Thermodesulfatator autotrophicus TaxID=1795632 RepID=UPI0018D44853|nr:aminopeptidase P family protein [Thermodesulfatator autotrophicus]
MEERKKRLRRVRLSLPKEGALLITCPENRRYLSGFSSEDVSLTESSGALLITRKEAFILTDPRYQEEAKACGPLFEPRIYRKGLVAELALLLPLLGVKTILIEPRYVSVALLQAMEKKLSVKIEMARPVIERMREVKDAEEVRAIRKALSIAEEILSEVAGYIKAGITERELSARIISMSHEIAHGPSFPPIVASGPNAAKPHAEPTDKSLKAGEPLIIDMGVKWQGYCSDITRTFFVEKITEKFKYIYKTVKEAKEAAEQKIKAGIKAQEPDEAARIVFRREALERLFWHSLGHGVGLAIHEAPTLSYRSRRKLKAGQVVTVEPGLYLPGWGGVRLEDMVVVTDDGFTRLNTLGFLEF